MTEKEIEKLFTYHTPNPQSTERLKDLRESAKIFANIINNLVPESPDKSAAYRKLRECVMTCNAAIVLNQDLYFASLTNNNNGDK